MHENSVLGSQIYDDATRYATTSMGLNSIRSNVLTNAPLVRMYHYFRAGVGKLGILCGPQGSHTYIHGTYFESMSKYFID